MPNRLASETSPYLLQHSDNPVDWFPWGEAALGLARDADRPLLVSIGYSACHWCHVMERECFEDASIASLMNESFVCIKVDREERPDVDALCMEACQALTGRGGWPLNVFMTPDQQPFFAGTYFPPEQRGGLPSWPMVLAAIADAWQRRRGDVARQGAELAAVLGASARLEPAEALVPASVVADSVAALAQTFDHARGGWGRAPKFPPHCTLEFLLAAGERQLALATLRAMAAGGIYDQIGGGFARYAVDASWTVPHFEKMLYDNALLARAYLHGWQVSGEERLREVCCETLDWALRELRGPEGGFASSLDADSDGVEGTFYVWTVDELREVLGSGSLYDEALAWLGATEHGNFERDANVLTAHGPVPARERAAEIRRLLFEARSERVAPARDDKRLTAWNALMISALGEAGAVLAREDYVEAARACAAFILESLRDDDGHLLRTWKDGRVHLAAYLDDHAFLLQGLLVLYEATFERRWYREAVSIAEALLSRFSDPERGGFFTTAAGEPFLVTRAKDLEDTPIPSGNAAAALGLLRLARLSGEARYEQAAVGVLRLHGPLAARHPGGFGHLLQALDFLVSPVREVAIVGDDADGAGPLARAVRELFRPHLVLAGGDPDDGRDGVSDGVPLLEGRGLLEGRAAAYVCEHFTCQAPVSTVEALLASLV